MNQIFLITGSNLKNKLANLEGAAQEIKKQIGTILKSSSVYETEAWGIENQPTFYNQVHQVGTQFSATEVMALLLEIEKDMGRIRTTKNAARIIDIDILFFNDAIIHTKDVVIPHKEIQNRRFVLMPLNELAPHFIHPQLKITVKQLLKDCQDPLKVKSLSTI
ncbi:MAG: 2-amino-4-hydroxy-6-hydroxymethyldihydropteridine diphosphokinase [Ginsengibacter sp.]